MSMHLYRREERPTLRVPVVFPQVDVDVDDDGRIEVRLDGAPYGETGVLSRGDLQRVVTAIAVDLASAVRVDVRESDGTTFTDIITPPFEDASPVPPEDEPGSQKLRAAAGEVCRTGLLPGEEVAVVVVVARVTADAAGTARFRLPSALAAAREVLLISQPAPPATTGAA